MTLSQIKVSQILHKKALLIWEHIYKTYFIKITYFYSSKDTGKKMERLDTDLEKYFKIIYQIKDLYPEHTKCSCKLIKTKSNNPIKNGQTILRDTSSKIYGQQIDSKNKFSIINQIRMIKIKKKIKKLTTTNICKLEQKLELQYKSSENIKWYNYFE